MNTVTVSQLNRYVSSLLDSDKVLSDIYVSGEISTLRKYSSGHNYFTLKDNDCAVSCVMFKNKVDSSNYKPEEGQKVILRARASLYDRDGKFQLYVNEIKPDGIGELFEAYEKLKNKLLKEGLFDQAKKKKIPFLPNKIGIATSISGAVIKDIINVSQRRFPGINLQIYPVRVQGKDAAQLIISAIKEFNRRNEVDVIIIARGGGSMEDLWCFNDEDLARTIYSSLIPVISAVGHETDFTICDFVADLRAPTPSAAAEIAVPIKFEIEESIKNHKERLTLQLIKRVEYSKLHLHNIVSNGILANPQMLWKEKAERVETLRKNLKVITLDYVKNKKTKISLLISALDSLSPLQVLSRGYGIIENINKEKRVRSYKDASPNERLNIILKDGTVQCDVVESSKGVKK